MRVNETVSASQETPEAHEPARELLQRRDVRWKLSDGRILDIELSYKLTQDREPHDLIAHRVDRPEPGMAGLVERIRRLFLTLFGMEGGNHWRVHASRTPYARLLLNQKSVQLIVPQKSIPFVENDVPLIHYFYVKPFRFQYNNPYDSEISGANFATLLLDESRPEMSVKKLLRISGRDTHVCVNFFSGLFTILKWKTSKFENRTEYAQNQAKKIFDYIYKTRKPVWIENLISYTDLVFECLKNKFLFEPAINCFEYVIHHYTEGDFIKLRDKYNFGFLKETLEDNYRIVKVTNILTSQAKKTSRNEFLKISLKIGQNIPELLSFYCETQIALDNDLSDEFIINILDEWLDDEIKKYGIRLSLDEISIKRALWFHLEWAFQRAISTPSDMRWEIISGFVKRFKEDEFLRVMLDIARKGENDLFYKFMAIAVRHGKAHFHVIKNAMEHLSCASYKDAIMAKIESRLNGMPESPEEVAHRSYVLALNRAG